MKKELYIISLDFEKVFDSMKRDKLLQMLKHFKIHPGVIDIIYEIYKEDRTKIYLDKKVQCTINITNGIRLGYNGSANLFILITYYCSK